MKIKVTSIKDLWAGFLFLALGVVGIAVAQGYPIGNALAHGAWVFSSSCSAARCWIVGATLSIRSLVVVEAPPQRLPAGRDPRGAGCRGHVRGRPRRRLGHRPYLCARDRGRVSRRLGVPLAAAPCSQLPDGGPGRHALRRLAEDAAQDRANAMELIDHMLLGFSVALSPQNLLYCFLGVTIGTLIGVLPGIGPLAGVAMLLPLTYVLPPAAAVIMLAGIFYGAQYGGSITSILVNMPGDASAVVTCIDGHAMALQGRAGPALAISAIGSFVAGCAATLAIMFLAPPLTTVALQFGPTEYFALMVVGLVTAISLAHGSQLKGFAMVVFGLLLGIVGTDVQTGTLRYTFGSVAAVRRR